VIATRVANEFMTMILNEDVRTRTNFAAETTGFLDHESRRLEGDLSALELKIAELKRREALNLPTNEVSPAEAQLAALKAELVQKSSLFSASHPDIKSLKLRIAALETTMGSSSVKTEKQDVGIEALTRQEEALQKQLETTNQKLATARMGEKLERGQQSERLEVIEQPSLPQKPASPNRPKFMAIVLAAAAACGGVLVFLLESLDGTIRRTADLGGLLPSDLLVTIPYIATTAEVRRQTTHRRIAIALTVIVTVVAIGIAAVLLPVEQWWNGFLSRVSS
jgi:capsule polysaccharide export protein KpsE/RkpR